MRVREKTKTFDSVQWTGTNKKECDNFVGEKSTKENRRLLYMNVAGMNKLAMNGFLVQTDTGIMGMSEDTFNAHLEAVT